MQTPTKYETELNLKIAKALGLALAGRTPKSAYVPHRETEAFALFILRLD